MMYSGKLTNSNDKEWKYENKVQLYIKQEYNETIISHPAINLQRICIEYGTKLCNS